MPPFISGLQSVLNELSTWLLYIVPGVVILTLAIGGFNLSKAEDAMEVKDVKQKMQRVIVGAALAGSAVWLGNWLWGILG